MLRIVSLILCATLPVLTKATSHCDSNETSYYVAELQSTTKELTVGLKLWEDKLQMWFVAPINRWFGLGFAASSVVPGQMDGTDAIVSGSFHGTDYAAVEATLSSVGVAAIDTTIDLVIQERFRVRSHMLMAQRPTVPEPAQTPADYIIPFPPPNNSMCFIWALGSSNLIHLGHGTQGYVCLNFTEQCQSKTATPAPVMSWFTTQNPTTDVDDPTQCFRGQKSVSCDPYLFNNPHFSNKQRALPLCPAINFNGPDLTSVGNTTSVHSFLGQVKWFPVQCSNVPYGYIPCDGSFIFNNGTTQRLYEKLFGAVGQSRRVFDCKNRLLVGTNSPTELGDCRGHDSQTWTIYNMPRLDFPSVDVTEHNCTRSCQFHVNSIETVSHIPQPVDNRQQLIYVQYYIIANGQFPVVGSIVASFVAYPNLNPVRFVPCDGRELSIADYPELYDVLMNLSTDYVASANKFFIPNCLERTLVGAGPQQTGSGQSVQPAIGGGALGGHNFFTLAPNNIDGSNLAARISTTITVYGSGCRATIQAHSNTTCQDISNMMDYVGAYFYMAIHSNFAEIVSILQQGNWSDHYEWNNNPIQNVNQHVDPVFQTTSSAFAPMTTGVALIGADYTSAFGVIGNDTSNVISCYHIDYLADKTINWECCPRTTNPTAWWRPTHRPSKSPSSTSPTVSPTATTSKPTVNPSRNPSQNPILAPTPTIRPVRTISPTGFVTPKPTTSRPTVSPQQTPTNLPTTSPSTHPASSSPSQSPTKSPSGSPTLSPTRSPSDAPSDAPTDAPTDAPSDAPSNAPTIAPSGVPTTSPSDAPTNTPSDAPSNAPSKSPSDAPSDAPTTVPSDAPTNVPSIAPSTLPSDAPSVFPSSPPSSAPSTVPSTVPSDLPSVAPTDYPSQSPTDSPSNAPTTSPSDAPTDFPTLAPSDCPSDAPTDVPTIAPTSGPTNEPTEYEHPTGLPTTNQPSAHPRTTAPTTSNHTCNCQSSPEWGDWSTWSTCVYPTESFNPPYTPALTLDAMLQCRSYGLMYRTRSCEYGPNCCPDSSFEVSVAGVGLAQTQANPLGLNSDDECQGESVQFTFCSRCNPIDGQWSSWCKWGPCINGIRSRSRTCSEPAPACGGRRCEGNSTEFEVCESCYWTPFGKWSSCIAGKQTRTRYCVRSDDDIEDSPSCLCHGPRFETRNCDPSLDACLGINIHHDDRVNEMTWGVFDMEGTSMTQTLQQSSGDSCIPVIRGNTYFLKVFDEFGDGVCCKHGQGYISWSVDGNQLGKYEEDSNWSVKVFTITVPPAAHCFQFEVHGKNLPLENSWSITDGSNGVIASGNQMGSDVISDCIPSVVSLNQTSCFTFHLSDSQGDGICCEQGEAASIRLFYNSQLVQSYRTDSPDAFATKALQFCL